MSHNSGGGYQSSDHGDRHQRKQIRVDDLVSGPSAPSTSQLDAYPYDQASTFQQPVAYGTYPQAGYGPVVYPSQGVQPPRPLPDPYQNVQQSGPQYSGPYVAPAQQESTELKRTRESSSSSGGEHKHKRKHGKRHHGSHGDHHSSHEHHHRSPEQHQGGQGSSVPQGSPQIPPNPMQNTSSMSGFGAAVPLQGSYGEQATYQPQYDPFAGHRESAPSSYPSDTGRGSAPQPQAGTSAHGAGRTKRQSKPVVLPSMASMNFDIDNIKWRGDTFDVEETKYSTWTWHQIHQLWVIGASFESWEEVERLKQPHPGQRTVVAMRQKLQTDKDWRHWTLAEDQELLRMGPPPENGLDAAGETFCSQHKRSRAEVYGRRRMFARGVPLYANLGNTPTLAKRKG